MSDPAGRHAEGLSYFAAGRLAEALAAFRRALAETDTAEIWNDWATAQYALGYQHEAEAGFRLALGVDPKNAQAALNLGALLLSSDRSTEAVALLELAANHLPANQAAAAADLLVNARARPASEISAKVIEDELRRFLSTDANEVSYFETHLKRYVETLKQLPQAGTGHKLLEMGAAFHHLTPSLLRLKGYSEVRCNDIWDGARQATREIRSVPAGETLSIVVDNFDIQSSPWPYENESFDAVLFCEMLEHLHTDPMAVFAELNRILRSGGTLLLTTPNLVGCHSVGYALRGESPYVYGKFEAHGGPTDRHNREYTPGEIERLGRAAGFEPVRLETRHSWWPPDRQTLRLLASRGESISLRGDNIFSLVRKVTRVRDRYPEEFYLRLGTQAVRRNTQGESRPAGSALGAACPSPQPLLVIHDLVPHFDQSGSDLRLLEVLRELRRQGQHVTFIARDWRDSERYSPVLEDLGIRVLAGDPSRMKHLGADEATTWSLPELLQTEHYGAAILCQWFWSEISVPEHYLHEIRRCSPATRIAILTDDRHGERERRAAKLSGHFSDLERANDFEARELAAYQAADLLLYITEADHAHFRQLLPRTPMEHLPIVATIPDLKPTGFGERSGMLFLGNFENLANRDALQWMLDGIWPLVRKRLPDLTLYVAGNACPEDFRADQGIVSLGKVASLASTFRSRIALAAPIRFGTGINTKNLQALAHGLPVITTSIGAEGLGLKNGQDALIADSTRGFADNISRICSEPHLWQSLATNGAVLVSGSFSPAQLSQRVGDILARLSTLAPKAAGCDTLASYLDIDRSDPEVLTFQPAKYRSVLRTFCYWQRGSAQLAIPKPALALAQFRHIFASLRGQLPDTVFHRRLLSDMAAAYHAVHDTKPARRCELELTNLVPLRNRPAILTNRHPSSAASSSPAAPRLSVVLPTYNRKPTLALCLAALAFQTLPADQWEVIVVDDGSTDNTPDFLAASHYPFQLKTVRQTNQGAGAARNSGVTAAQGELVLLLNDDTIASSTLLEQHLYHHQLHKKSRIAILGQFFPSSACGRRALSFWINHSSFLFPQQTLQPGQLCDSALFVTCNLSVRRQALLDAGNFDPMFRVAEDSEMGARLAQLGYQVRFEPSASATHEHSQFTTEDLLRRAALYGGFTWQLLNKHPQLLGDGNGPFGNLSAVDLHRIAGIRQEKAPAAESGVAALRALDNFDISTLWTQDASGVRPVDSLMEKISAVVPVVYWHQLFEHFLAAAENAPHCQPPINSTVSELAAP
jgi:GT2 family glycosyltransferase/SAM-dependent methyltransferase/glycosyltransferase involved in cell wall biosynthesis